jgi:hypothetical protein
MKTKIAITVALCALFVAVPSATPKGKPAGEQLSLICGAGACSATASGLSGTGTYAVNITDDCGDTLIATSVNAPGQSVSVDLVSTTACTVTTVTAQLFVSTHGKLTLLQTATAHI